VYTKQNTKRVSKKKYKETNKEKIIIYHDNYRTTNNEKINAKNNCLLCGCCYTHSNFARHIKKSLTHQKFINNIQQMNLTLSNNIPINNY
jgi:CTP:phosphocholine cytidylyltransferase-like protein